MSPELTGLFRYPGVVSKFPLYLAQSTIENAGLGVFVGSNVNKGNFLAVDIFTSEDVRLARDISFDLVDYSDCRVDDLCFITEREGDFGNYFNHSCNPNVLWHLGYMFALKDIGRDQELFIDYRHMDHPSWPTSIVDKNGVPIRGLPWKESIRITCRQILKLLDDS